MIKVEATFLLVLALLLPLPSLGAPPPFEIDLKELERPSAAAAAKSKGDKERSEQRSRKRSDRAGHRQRSDGYLRYTVQPGDHIFKILTGRLGMSNDAAEELIPRIVRTNRIRDIKNLTVGETLLIPNREQRAAIARNENAVKVPAGVRGSETTVMPTPARDGVHAAPPPSPLPPPGKRGEENEVTAPPATTWVCPVPERDPAAAIDSLLALLEAPVTRGKTVQAGQGADGSLSVQLERYFEFKGGRYIVSIGENDPDRYTLLRLLETAGYRVLRVDAKDDFRGLGEKLLRSIGMTPDFGSHPLQQGKALNGFLIKQEGTMGRRVVVSAEPPASGERWVLAPECGAR